jgi:3',5'-cyclic AMP phosphodiesterase CpdA
MKTIIHLSDLHFGRIRKPVMAPLIKEIESFKPDLLVISGDLTMRAKTKEFAETKAFLDSLPYPKIIVPGNHDIPLYNIFSRFFRALKKFKHYITEDLFPIYRDEEMAVYGLNTARSWLIMKGEVDLEQISKICAELNKLPNHLIKIIVTHHPFDLPFSKKQIYLIKRSRIAMEMLLLSRADLFLAGHVHASITHIPEICKEMGYNSLLIQAGTATSVRTRREENAFNVLKLDYPRLEVTTYFWDLDQGNFHPKVSQNYQHSKNGWKINDVNIP